MRKFFPLMALIMTSCQLGPFYYTLDRDADGHNETSVHHTGYHGAHGCAYQAGRDAVLLARDLTDEELDDAYPYPGVGYDDSKWSAENANEEEMCAQQVFQDENGDVIILDDNGEIIYLENCVKRGVRVG